MTWYKQGTIAASGVTVTGTGTNWTDNKMGIGPGQALLIPGAGVVKMYEIARVNGATSITLASDAGTVAAGSTYAIMSFYTDSRPDFNRRLAAQLSYYQSQMDGWQQIMTSTGSFTLEAPDGQQVTISSFKKLTDDMTSLNNDVTSLNDGLKNKITAGTTANLLNIELGSQLTSDHAFIDFYTDGKNTDYNARIIAYSKTSELTHIAGKHNFSGPMVCSSAGSTFGNLHTTAGGGIGVYAHEKNAVEMNNYAGATPPGSFVSWMVHRWYDGFVQYGPVRGGSVLVDRFQLNVNSGQPGQVAAFMFYPNGVATAGQWSSLSDNRIKNDITILENPLEAMEKLRGRTWTLRTNGMRGYGFTADEMETAFPEAVTAGADITLPDGIVIEKLRSVDTSGVAAALHHEAILALMDRIAALEKTVTELKTSSPDTQITTH